MPFVARKKPCRIFTSCKASLYSFSREFIISTAGLLFFCPLEGRDGLPCGEPLPRWGQSYNRKSEKRDRPNIRFKTVGSNVRLQRRRGRAAGTRIPANGSPLQTLLPVPTSIMDGKTFPTPGADPGVLPAGIDFQPYLVIPSSILPSQKTAVHKANSQHCPEKTCSKVFVSVPESSQPEQGSQEESQENAAQNIGIRISFSWRGCFPGHFGDLGPFGFEIPYIDSPGPIGGPDGVQIDIPRLFFPDHFHFPYIFRMFSSQLFLQAYSLMYIMCIVKELSQAYIVKYSITYYHCEKTK